MSDRYFELIESKHVREQAERILPALTLIEGTRDASSLKEVIDRIATGIMALERFPDIQQTSNNGGITLIRGPRDGYSVHLWATDIYHLHLMHP